MRVLVVDDENIVIESVSHIINQSFENVTVQTAYNSREALIRFEQFRPHIIMTDLMMPGMNGIELIERIRRIDHQVKIIIVSAHDHFEFAKEAVKYQVEDYLLKPLSKQKLVTMLEKVMDKVKIEEQSRNQELGNIERFYQSIALVESNFFNSILLGRNYHKFITHYRTILELPFEKGQFAVIEFTNYTSKANPEQLSIFNQKVTACSEALKMEVKRKYNAIVSNPFLNRVMIYTEGEEGLLYQDVLQWVEQVFQKHALKVRIGLGRVKKIEHLVESYAESMMALKLSAETVAVFKTVRQGQITLNHLIDAKERVKRSFIARSRQFSEDLKHFEGLYLKMIANPNESELAEALLIELTVQIYDHFKPKQTQGQHYLSEMLHKSPMLKIHDFEKLMKEWHMVYIKLSNGNYNELTYEALKAIQKDYASEITLDAIAEKLNVSPPYLSKLFKEDTGVTFKEYLTELRMEASKRLLADQNISVKEIGFKVGYNDTNYFIRAFKKYEGVTPKDYQRMRI